MRDILADIFSNAARVKLLRLFVFNRDRVFDVAEASQRINVPVHTVRREIHSLLAAGFLKQKRYQKIVTRVERGKKIKVKRTVTGAILYREFPHLRAFHALLVETLPLRPEILARTLQKVGRVRAIVVSGLFMDNQESPLDLLVIGNDLEKGKAERAIHRFESVLGREIRYAIFSVEEFKYRLDIFDRLVRDVLEYPHKVLYNKLPLNLD
mgnify:CR=1 FL=1